MPCGPIGALPAFDCQLAAPPIVCCLALCSTVIWGTGPVIVKYAFSRGGTPLQAAVIILATDAATLWMATVIDGGPGAVSQFAPLAVAAFVTAGVLGTALGRLLVYTGIDRLGASINTAGVATRPLFATLIGVAALGEPVGVGTLVGVAVLTTGLVVLALSKGGNVQGWHRRDLGFPLLAAALYAAANAIRRVGLTPTAGVLEAVTINETAAVLALLGYVVVAGRTDELDGPRVAHGLFALVGVLTALGMLTLFAALRHPAGRVVIVDPLIAAAPLVTTLLAYALLGDVERVTRGVVAGAMAIVAGAVLVTVG